MPSLRTGDGRALAWREAGSGPPLVCHPGGPGCSGRYFGGLPELADERTLIVLDPRGTGDSDRPADGSAYDLEDYAADLEALREHLGLERIDVLGHSHGGFVAINWAGTHPERVGRLVLASTVSRFDDAIREARRRRVASHRGQPYFDDALAALEDHQAGRYANDEELRALYAREWRLLVPRGIDGQGVAAGLARAGNNSDALRHFNEQVAAGMDQRPALGRIEAPTLVLVGELDPFGGASAREMAGALPDPTLVVLPGADHFAFLESDDRRAAWSQAVLDFLAA
jgi:proline iminopeptidase